MSSTESKKAEGLLTWLSENAFWNSELVEVKKSKIGGLGVFWKLDDGDDPEKDRLLLRVPKSSILSPKNSFLYSLLVDHESSDPAIDLSSGMHAIVITFIYELSIGTKSPWFAYLESFSFVNAPVPLCLWTDDEKRALYNSECDLSNMLDPTELTAFFYECVQFARQNKNLVKIPDVFEFVDPSSEKLRTFGQFVQAVISRAFTVDKYLGLSLVPGADLFNHLSPIETEGRIEGQENVHFECDDDDDLCEDCGEVGCAHLEDEDEDDELLESLDGEDDDEVGNEDEDVVEEEEAQDFADLVEGNFDVDDSSSDSEEEHFEQSEDKDENNSIGDTSDVDETKPITLSDIADLEMESEAETVQDDEEVSTLSMSEDEGDNDEPLVTDPSGAELAEELSDGSKCCDIILTQLPSAQYKYELFNTYGNELSNPYLLQRYGFVSPQNPNKSCLLSVQMFSELKRLKKTKKAEQQMDLKLEWYEERGFDLVNEMCSVSENAHEHEHEGHNDEESCDDGCEDGCGDKCEDDCCSDSIEQEVPESWQLSPKINAEGVPTQQTIALIRLMRMHFNIFLEKLYRSPSERKLEKRIAKYLLEAEVTADENQTVRKWVSERLQRYKCGIDVAGRNADIIKAIIEEEKSLLEKAMRVLST